MPKGRGANHRRRDARQKAAVGCLNARGEASHCIGPDTRHKHVEERVKTPKPKPELPVITARRRSLWDRLKDWLRGVTPMPQPHQPRPEKTQPKERKEASVQAKAQRAQTMIRQKRG